jgi:FdhD protein
MQLVEEVALAININDINFAVMLASPYDIEDFVVGYLHSETIIEHNRDIHDITQTKISSVCADQNDNTDSIEINVTIANRCFSRMQERKRQAKGTASCGLCGTEAIYTAFPNLSPLSSQVIYPLELIADIKPQLRSWQTLAKDSGALHAAFWLDESGEILMCGEDIGRHNALDKLIGALLRSSSLKLDDTNQDFRTKGAILVTSRCGVELVQKCILFGASNLISLASPSTMAAAMAQSHNLNLIHVPKHDSPYLINEPCTANNTKSSK